MAEIFKNTCTCGGYAWQMNGRPEKQPHMAWCRQHDEYAVWWEKKTAQSGSAVTNNDR